MRRFRGAMIYLPRTFRRVGLDSSHAKSAFDRVGQGFSSRKSVLQRVGCRFLSSNIEVQRVGPRFLNRNIGIKRVESRFSRWNIGVQRVGSRFFQCLPRVACLDWGHHLSTLDFVTPRGAGSTVNGQMFSPASVRVLNAESAIGAGRPHSFRHAARR